MKERRVYYLILHVGGSNASEWAETSVKFTGKTSRDKSIRARSPRRMFSEAKKSAKSVDVYLQHIPVKYRNSSAGYQWRFLFRFNQYKSDDQIANRFAESFIYSMELLNGPVMNPYCSPFCFRVPAEIVGKKGGLTFEELEEIESKRLREERTISFPHIIGSALFTDENRVEAAWRITPIVYTDDKIHRALTFLAESQHDFFVYPGEMPEAIHNRDRLAENSHIQVNWETALQNAFKAIEAIIGDPPKDDRKFDQLLRSIGLDPYEKIVFEEEWTLREEIRSMNLARDKKAAHGGTSNRRLTVGELLNYQACAGYVCKTAIETKLGQPI
jgi:hypothetical protein